MKAKTLAVNLQTNADKKTQKIILWIAATKFFIIFLLLLAHRYLSFFIRLCLFLSLSIALYYLLFLF